jgi:hypothetical protein
MTLKFLICTVAITLLVGGCDSIGTSKDYLRAKDPQVVQHVPTTPAVLRTVATKSAGSLGLANATDAGAGDMVFENRVQGGRVTERYIITIAPDGEGSRIEIRATSGNEQWAIAGFANRLWSTIDLALWAAGQHPAK